MGGGEKGKGNPIGEMPEFVKKKLAEDKAKKEAEDAAAAAGEEGKHEEL